MSEEFTIPEAIFTVVERTFDGLRFSGADPGVAQNLAGQLVCRLLYLLPVCQDPDCFMIGEHRHVGEFVIQAEEVAKSTDDSTADCEPGFGSCVTVKELTADGPEDPDEEAEANEAPATERLAGHLARGGEIPGADGGRRSGRI